MDERESCGIALEKRLFKKGQIKYLPAILRAAEIRIIELKGWVQDKIFYFIDSFI
jgi:hypothetical protein